MARPFDESLSYQQIGSKTSSPTYLAGDRAWKTSTDRAYPSSVPYNAAAQSWATPSLTKKLSKKSSRPKLPKIKSSPNGALATSNAKLHKNGNLATGSTSPTFVPDYLLQTSSPIVPSSAHANLYAAPEPKASKSRVKIKPLLRKFSSQEQVSIDLSRSAAENEGLGIYKASEISAPSDLGSGRRGYHHRTTSADTQVSETTTSSGHRYGAHYVHPMRQTPRPYTPPVASTYKTSLESEEPTINTHGETPSFSSHSRQASNTTSTPYAPVTSSRRPPPLHIHTGSPSHSTSPSQTNLPGTPSSLRFNADKITPSDMVSPTTRSSLESALRKRSRSNTATTDPAARQAMVTAARQKFNEDEAAKELKYQQAEARAQEKEARRRERKEDGERRTSEKRERKRAKSNAASEKSSFLTLGEQRVSFTAVQMLPQEAPARVEPLQRRRTEKAGSAGKAVNSQWTLFWFRFKTMWLRFKRKMARSEG